MQISKMVTGSNQPPNRRCLPSVCITGNRRVTCVALAAVGINDSGPLKLHVRVQANLSLFGTEAPPQSIHRFSETRTALREKRHERIIKSARLVLSTVLGGMWDAAWFRYEGIIRRKHDGHAIAASFSLFVSGNAMPDFRREFDCHERMFPFTVRR